MAKTHQTTLADVARRAGCSVPVVSTVLNGASGNCRISPKNRRKVESIAQRLGYHPNYHAQSLRRGRSMMIGFALGRVVPATAHQGFWGELVAGVDDGANAEKHNLLIVRSTEKQEAVDHGLELLQQRQIDALVIPGVLYGDKMPQIEALDAPIVLVLPLRPSHHPRVGINHEPGLRQAAQHLHALGHSEVLWAGLSVGGKVQEAARQGFFDHAAHELGMRTREMIIRGGDTPLASGLPSLVGAGREHLAAYLSVQDSPTAIMAYNEIAGFGIYAALRDAGYCVPRDVSVIGYDDIVSELAMPQMTVISHKLREAGRAAAGLGIQMAADRKRLRELRGHERWIPTELVVRESTGPCRTSKVLHATA